MYIHIYNVQLYNYYSICTIIIIIIYDIIFYNTIEYLYSIIK